MKVVSCFHKTGLGGNPVRTAGDSNNSDEFDFQWLDQTENNQNEPR
jgi:hypothetical protein